jgi:hypothetical protein
VVVIAVFVAFLVRADYYWRDDAVVLAVAALLA